MNDLNVFDIRVGHNVNYTPQNKPKRSNGFMSLTCTVMMMLTEAHGEGLEGNQTFDPTERRYPSNADLPLVL